MRTKAVSFRQASEADASTIVRHRYYEPNVTPQALLEYEEWLRGSITSCRYVGWLAVVDDGVIGGAGAVMLDWGPTRDDPNPLRARIVNVFTEPKYRSGGIARELTGRVLGEVEARGVRTMILAATDQSRGIYEALGFSAYPAEMIRKVRPAA